LCGPWGRGRAYRLVQPMKNHAIVANDGHFDNGIGMAGVANVRTY
jgi:S-adenosylhomocysteine hydrolase